MNNLNICKLKKEGQTWNVNVEDKLFMEDYVKNAISKNTVDYKKVENIWSEKMKVESLIKRKVDTLQTLKDCNFLTDEQKTQLREIAKDWASHQERKKRKDNYMDYVHRDGAQVWVLNFFEIGVERW